MVEVRSMIPIYQDNQGVMKRRRMFLKIPMAGGRCARRHVLMLVAVFFFAMSIVTEPFAATAMETSGSWINISFVTTGDAMPVSHSSNEVECSIAGLAGHSASPHCTATLPGFFSSGTSNARLGCFNSPMASWKTVGKKPPHGPPKSIFLN